MKIKKVSIVGLGALGILFGQQIEQSLGRDFSVIADQDRVKKYQTQGIYCNGQVCDFSYSLPEDQQKADLILFCVKFDGLEDAIHSVRNHVGDHTMLMSLLNGISSETVIAQAFGKKNLIWSVAQGMDTIKEGNHLTYTNPGMVCFGDQKGDPISEKVLIVKEFFDWVGIANEIDQQMEVKIWSKFLLNVGINQVVAVYGEDFGSVQMVGELRERMIAAMREVIPLANLEGVPLSEKDVDYWLKVVDGLDPKGKPSMRQDVEAKRFSEVELFSGTVLEFSRKYGIDSPVNQDLYGKIKVIEASY
ncbi:ketopantoate reductase family protein [Eubacteriaceae bacterium ES2]|nr:ketopantoate reductase family protein [Eubacteriaceae bacterium ES2]